MRAAMRIKVITLRSDQNDTITLQCFVSAVEQQQANLSQHIIDTFGNTMANMTNAKKSILVPTQEIIFLGFVINTLTMTLTLTQEKKTNFFRYMSTSSR